MILVLTLIVLLVSKLINPIKKLQRVSKKISEGDVEAEIFIPGKNELSLLAENLNRMKNSLKDKIKELDIYKKYIDDIINSMPSMLIGVDGDFKIVQWNRKAVEVTGISPEEAVGKELPVLFPAASEFMGSIEKAVSMEQVEFLEYFPLQLDSRNLFLNILVYPLVIEGESGAVVIIDDVTKQYRMREELSHVRKMDAVGQLAGGVAHDFNNMLGGILGSAELLARRINKESKEREYLDMIVLSAERAADITGKLLAFSRKGKVYSRVIDVIRVIRDTAVLLEHGNNKNITIELNMDCDEAYVVGDSGQIQSAFMNIGINAVHSMKNGGKISFSAGRMYLDKFFCSSSPFKITPGEYIKIEISDRGEGIPPENIGHIFEPFFTTKEIGEGTGLGLSAVYGTVVDHHGAITVYSEVGSGTSFHIYLPLSAKPDTVSVASEPAPVSGSGLVLVVDDEKLLRTTARDILEELGYDVILAEDGILGLEKFRQSDKKIDLVLLDMIMPGMSGKEVFYKLKKIDPDVKVVLSSGFTRENDINEMIKEGLSGFIRKPYTMSLLSRTLSKVLEKGEDYYE